MTISDINKPQKIDFQRVGTTSLGYITIAEYLPFQIERVYWTYYAPHDVIRGHHAHKELQQILFAVSGVIKFEIENVEEEKYHFELNSPNDGLYIPKMHWRRLQFSHNAVLLCLASHPYNETDYIRDYTYFKTFKPK